jgi:hypothetical protein
MHGIFRTHHTQHPMTEQGQTQNGSTAPRMLAIATSARLFFATCLLVSVSSRCRPCFHHLVVASINFHLFGVSKGKTTPPSSLLCIFGVPTPVAPPKIPSFVLADLFRQFRI